MIQEKQVLPKTIQVKLVRSLIGVRRIDRATIKCLGLRRLNSTREILDTPEARGRIRKVSYLIQVS